MIPRFQMHSGERL